MLPAQFADHDHGSSGFIYQIATLLDLDLYASFELLFGDEIINKRVVEEHERVPLLTSARVDVP
jgi:hypothetical protein